MSLLEMSTQRTIARNVVCNAAGIVADMVVGFVLARYLYRHLGETRYGWWLIIAALTSYFGFFDLGLRGSVGRNIAFHRARDDAKQVNTIVSTAVLILSLTAGVILLATCALPTLFFSWYDVPPADQSGVRLALLLVGANLALTFPLSVFDAVLWAYQRFDVQNAIDIPLSLVRGTLSLMLVAWGGGLVGLACIVVAGTIVSAVLKAVCSFRADPALRLGWPSCSWQAARDLFNFGFWQFVLGVGRKITAQIAAPVIGANLGEHLVPRQSVAARLTGYAESVVFAATTVLTPVATGLHATEGHDRQRGLFLEGGKYCTVLALFFVIAFLCIGPSFITLWMGPGLESAGALLAILALGELLPLSQWISYSVVLGMGRHRTLALFSILEITLVAVLIAVLIGPQGVVGVCVALAAAGVLCRGLLQLLYTCCLLEVSPWTYVRRVFVPAVVVALAPAAGLAALSLWNPPGTWVEFLVYSSSYVIMYLVSGCLVLLGWERTLALAGMLLHEIGQLRYGTSGTP